MVFRGEQQGEVKEEKKKKKVEGGGWRESRGGKGRYWGGTKVGGRETWGRTNVKDHTLGLKSRKENKGRVLVKGEKKKVLLWEKTVVQGKLGGGGKVERGTKVPRGPSRLDHRFKGKGLNLKGTRPSSQGMRGVGRSQGLLRRGEGHCPKHLQRPTKQKTTGEGGSRGKRLKKKKKKKKKRENKKGLKCFGSVTPAYWPADLTW